MKSSKAVSTTTAPSNGAIKNQPAVQDQTEVPRDAKGLLKLAVESGFDRQQFLDRCVELGAAAVYRESAEILSGYRAGTPKPGNGEPKKSEQADNQPAASLPPLDKGIVRSVKPTEDGGLVIVLTRQGGGFAHGAAALCDKSLEQWIGYSLLEMARADFECAAGDLGELTT